MGRFPKAFPPLSPLFFLLPLAPWNMYDLRLHMIILLAVRFCRASVTGRYPPAVVQFRDFKGHSVRQGASSCNPLSADDVKTLPAYATLLSTAQANWGDGSFNLVTNDPSLPNSPALSCVQTDPVTISLGTPACTTSNQELDGTLQSNGSVTAQTTEGTTATASITVTKESQFSSGSSTQVGFSIPDFPIGISETLSFSTTLSNTLSYSSTSTANTQQSQTITYNPIPGEDCHLELTAETCNAVGTGEVLIVATGTVWFEFNDRTDGHYKWGLVLEDVVPDVSQRSSPMSVQVQINSNTNANYMQTCNSGSTTINSVVAGATTSNTLVFGSPTFSNGQPTGGTARTTTTTVGSNSQPTSESSTSDSTSGGPRNIANLGLLFMIVAIHTIVFG
ncbi:hypothetical protein MVEN_00141100 [Mycena venus]|uniref:Uncharacterized protein n=1 Tax=Mycena venus TaxID=2733690 RepID=A0A8H6YXE1_9AGAR|nr:hypothetical protein MVEN_00141100 [Mycena venus]